MSQYTSGYPATTAAPSSSEQPTSQVARDEAGEVGRTAADAGRQVVGTAAEQAKTVAQEATAQARDLVGEVRGQVQQQARNGQQKATEGIRSLTAELREMAGSGVQQGTVSEVARQLADRADRLADWLGEREPGDLLDEVRSFARRRPGGFLVGAALAGVVVGRLTRGAVDAARSEPGTGPVPPGSYGDVPVGPAVSGTSTYGTAVPPPPVAAPPPVPPLAPPPVPPVAPPPVPPVAPPSATTLPPPATTLPPAPPVPADDPFRPGYGDAR
jgi:hypothetical protein